MYGTHGDAVGLPADEAEVESSVLLLTTRNVDQSLRTLLLPTDGPKKGFFKIIIPKKYSVIVVVV